jgi:PKD repeat protein
MIMKLNKILTAIAIIFSFEVIGQCVPLPQVAFTAPTVCFGTTTVFMDQTTISSGNIASWSWNFGDPLTTNDISSLQNPTYLYTTSGTFNVTLICTSSNGCVSLLTIPVFVNTVPVANFNAISSCLGTATIFNDLSVPTTGVVANWVWDFGDGSPISNQQKSFIYLS